MTGVSQPPAPPAPTWGGDAGPGPAAPLPPKTPLHRRPLFWVALGGGLLVVLVVVGLVLALVVGGAVAASRTAPAPAPATASTGTDAGTDAGTDPGTDGGVEEVPAEVPAGDDEDVFDLAVGDCLAEVVPDAEVDEVPVTSCDAPHVSEAYSSHTIEAEALPDEAAFEALVDEVCLPAFEAFVGLPYEESVLYVSSLSPTPESWDAGDRELLCLLDAPEGEVLTGSARGTAR
jgi:hypothetical protein